MTGPYRITIYDGASRNAALVAAREARKSPQWQDVQRTGRIVTAVRVCTGCREPIDGPTIDARDAELMRHWRECLP